MYSFILFLDFDGVLHPGTSGTMRFAAKLEAFLERFPHVMVVISSNWRMGESLESLRGWFSPAFASRIIDVTPIHPDSPGSRQAEIEAWLAANPTKAWRALDDDTTLFQPNCTWLIATNKRDGLTNKELDQLASAIG